MKKHQVKMMSLKNGNDDENKEDNDDKYWFTRDKIDKIT